MAIYLVEESVVKATMPDLPDAHPLWDIFEDGPIRRMDGQPFLHLDGPAVAFRVGKGFIVLPSEIVQEIDEK